MIFMALRQVVPIPPRLLTDIYTEMRPTNRKRKLDEESIEKKGGLEIKFIDTYIGIIC